MKIIKTLEFPQHFSWTELSKMISSGNSPLKVGDRIEVSLTNGRKTELIAVHENPYSPNTMAFVFSECLSSPKGMNARSTFKGGWSCSKLRKFLNQEVLALLPEELIRVVKPRTIIQNIGGRTYQSTDILWVPSQTEVFGASEVYSQIDTGDVPFSYFSARQHRIKTAAPTVKTTPANVCWWLRTPYSGGGSYVRVVNAVGNMYVRYAYNYSGVLPALIL